MSKSKEERNYKVVGRNRRARYDYAIEDEIECGVMLEGSEVKSLRSGEANIAESYASVEDAELWLINGYIAPYDKAKSFKHAGRDSRPHERRKRKLLVRKRELARLWSATKREGMTLVPLALYFNHKGIVELKIGIAKGKKLADKRQAERKRDWNLEKARLLRRQ